MTREELKAKVAWWKAQKTMYFDNVLDLIAAVVDLLPEEKTYTVTGLTSATEWANIPQPAKTFQEWCEQVMPPQMNVKGPAKDRTKGEQVAEQFDLSLKTGIGWLSGHTVELAKAIDAALSEQRAALEKEHFETVYQLGVKSAQERSEAVERRDKIHAEDIAKCVEHWRHDAKCRVEEAVATRDKEWWGAVMIGGVKSAKSTVLQDTVWEWMQEQRKEAASAERARITGEVEKLTLLAKTPTAPWVSRTDVLRAISPPPA